MDKNFNSLFDVWQEAQDIAALSGKELRKIPVETFIRLLLYGEKYFEQETIRIANTYFSKELKSDCIAVYIDCFFRKWCLAQTVMRTYTITYGYNMLFQCDYTHIQTVIIHELCHLVLPKSKHNKEFYLLVESKLKEAALIDDNYNGWRETEHPYERMYFEPGESWLNEQKIDIIRKRVFSFKSSTGPC